MSDKRKIEIFSAGCPACEEAVKAVNEIACPSCEVEVLDTHQPEVTARAAEYGVRGVPAVVVDGKLASCCCALARVDEAALRASGVGTPLP